MTDEPKTKFDEWALVELFGHQRIAGRVTEQALGGGSFLRVDVPDEHGQTRFTRFYGAAAIYSINPVSREACLLLAKQIDAAPVKQWDLPLLTAHKEPDFPEHEFHHDLDGKPEEQP